MKYETNPNEPNSKKAKMNVSSIITRDYENISNWAKRTQSKPILAKKCKNKPNSNPNKANFKRLTYLQEIAFGTACELVKITGPGETSGPNYMTKASLNNWKAEKL
jgi:hypothetical protein